MGNVNGAEHKSALQTFQDYAVEMVEMALAHTTLDQEHISVKRMRLLQEQIKGMNFTMLVYFSKKWCDACSHVIRKQIPEEEHLDNYIADLKTVRLTLPNNGNGLDVHDVIIAIPMEQKKQIVEKIHTTHDYATLAIQKGKKPPQIDDSNSD